MAKEIEALPIGAGWRAIMRRCKADLARAAAPPVPFSVPPDWYAVTTLGQLFEVGERLKNCVAGLKYGGDHHLIDLITGRSFYLSTINDPPALATIKNLGPKMWTLGDFSALGERKALMKARELLTARLAVEATLAGHTFFNLCPLSILSGFSWKIEERQADADEEMQP